jgi:aspartyl-tRNA(Asn)/glutamyl-tRNA(Gln) amidotransferase subunit C
MSLTRDQVNWVAHLARLELSAADLETMTRQLSSIIDYVTQLQQVNTDGVEPLAHPLPIQNVFRADEPKESLPADEALANAPDRQGDFYGVPAVLD